MHFFTSLTRMWLTRSVRPFTFRKEYDQALPFAECESLGLYVHIPFCKSICNFCPYCKVRYSAKLCDRYIDSLIQEIHLVGGQYPGRKKATSLYFGIGKCCRVVRCTLKSVQLACGKRGNGQGNAQKQRNDHKRCSAHEECLLLSHGPAFCRCFYQMVGISDRIYLYDTPDLVNCKDKEKEETGS